MQGMAPSGPMVVQSNDWYGQQGGSMPEDYEVTPDQQPYDGTDGPVETADASSGSDPLSGMEPLRQALPDDGNNNNSN